MVQLLYQIFMHIEDKAEALIHINIWTEKNTEIIRLRLYLSIDYITLYRTSAMHKTRH